MAATQSLTPMNLQPVAGLSDPTLGTSNNTGISAIGDPFATPSLTTGTPAPSSSALADPNAATTGTTSLLDSAGNLIDPFATNTAGTGTAATGSSSTSGISSLLGGIGQGLFGTSGVPSLSSIGQSIGSALPYAGTYAAAQSAATAQQNANTATIQPLTTQATQYLDAASQQLGLFQSGTLSPGQQAQIDQYAANQKSQIAQQMAGQGITDSSALNSAYQQIDNNALIMKSNFVQTSLSNALGLEGAGMTPLMTAVQDKLTSDTQITDTMTQLMGTLAQAWAYQTGQAARGSGSGTGTGAATGAAGAGSSPTSALTSLATKYGLNAATNAISGAGTDLSSYIPSAASSLATSAAGVGDLTAAPGLAANLADTTSIGSGIVDAALGGSAAAGGATAAGLADVGAGLSSDLAATSAIGSGIADTALGGAGAASGAAGGAAGAGAGLGLGAELGIAGLAAGGLYALGESSNWFGNNSKSSVTNQTLSAPQAQISGNQVTVPQGSVVQWNGVGGSGRIIGTAQGGTTLAMQATYKHDPGDPVLYPPGGNAYTGTGGWELKGFHKGQDQVLTNQSTGQTVSITDPNFQQVTGITPAQFQQMYTSLTTQYKQGQTG